MESRYAEPDPGHIFSAFNAHQLSAALRGAIQLDLFTCIARGQETSIELAESCHADPRAMRILCDFLVVHGFLTKSANRYGLSPTSSQFLSRDSETYMGSIAEFVNAPHLLAAFDDVAALVRGGSTMLEGDGFAETNYDGWVNFARTMVPLVMPSAEFIAELSATRLAGPRRVLDLAAGHGMFGISVAVRNPLARVVALDWPAVLNVAEENAERLGVSERFSRIDGDALSLDFDGEYDLVMATNFFHHFDQTDCEKVMRKIAACLKPQGQVMTLEFVPNEDRVSPPAAATFAMMMLATTAAGDAYTFEDYRRMWGNAGLATHELLEVPKSESRLIISST